MQNIDFYSGNNPHNQNTPDFTPNDPEYFSRMASINKHSEIKRYKKTHRLISLIIGLCIISFTIGLIIGIKFVNDKKEIMDQYTKKKMNTLGSQVSQFIKEKIPGEETNIQNTNTIYPKLQFPYVIRLGKNYNLNKSKEIADFLNPRGHTIIITQHNNKYRLFTGPYKSRESAELYLKKLQVYKINNWYNNALVLKR